MVVNVAPCFTSAASGILCCRSKNTGLIEHGMLNERVMEDPRSVNSPRRVLSLSRKRKGTLSFPEPDDKASGFGPSGEHGPKPSEVYGFVGSISTVVATGILRLSLWRILFQCLLLYISFPISFASLSGCGLIYLECTHIGYIWLV